MKLTYDQWMEKVDQVLLDLCGLTSLDLVSYYCYSDAYRYGLLPETAARNALEAEGLDDEIDET